MLKFNSFILKNMALVGAIISPVYAVDYVYDELNRLTQVSHENGLIISYQYDATSNLLSIDTPSSLFPLGLAKAININDGFINSATQFSGSIVGSDGMPAKMLTISVGQTVDIKASITVDTADVGKIVDVLFVMGFEQPPLPYQGDADTTYYAVTPTNEFIFTDLYAAYQEWMPQLSQAYQPNVTLTDVTTLELGQWIFHSIGMNYLFAGYRLAEGTIVYTATPLMIEVIASEETSPSGSMPTPKAACGNQQILACNYNPSGNTYRVTTTRVSMSSNMDNACVSEFGASYRMADWADIESSYADGVSADSILMYQGTGDYFSAWVSQNGNGFYDSTRHYFASRHKVDHQKPSYYLAHSNIGNHLISLGSWYYDEPVLCYKK